MDAKSRCCICAESRFGKAPWQGALGRVCFGSFRARQGLALLEAAVSLVLLSAMLVGVIPLVAWRAREQSENQLRQAALCELENQLERLRALRFEELTEEACAKLALSESARACLPAAALAARLDRQEGGARRVTLEINLEDRRPRGGFPLRLSAWFYPTQGDPP